MYDRRDGLTWDKYQQNYAKSIEEPEQFWAEQADKHLVFTKKWQKVFSGGFEQGEFTWFDGAELNACYNCVDKHLPQYANVTAFIWQADEPGVSKLISYQQLHEQVCRLANVLKQLGVKKGDTVCIYLPMIPEAIYSMLACARIGAVHSVVFAGFSASALEGRINDANSQLVITAEDGVRGGKRTPLKKAVDIALQQCPQVKSLLVVNSINENPNTKINQIDYHTAVQAVDVECPCEAMAAEDPLFILYTSGSTGKPKGVLHTTAGYLLYTASTFQTTFDYQPGDIYWCTADVGWVTGHSYIVYGPLINRATSVIFEGVPKYPDASRCWQIVDEFNVNVFYTAPTAIRALMQAGDDFVQKTSRQSLKIIGTVGEPINPDVWQWYSELVGNGKCPVIDTWWQTETGGFLITPLAGITKLKPGSATLPFYGITPAIIDEQKNIIDGEGEGRLMIAKPWPGQMRTIYGDHDRFIKTYFAEKKGFYFSGDGARRDKDGYYWITGRVDDVINVSGHRLGTAEIESALVSRPEVAEAAVVGFPHSIKGEGIYAFVTVKAGIDCTDELKQQLVDRVNEAIGPIAKPDIIQYAPELPKTRSGKIMRRILRKIAAGQHDELGDISTLADPGVVSQLVESSLNMYLN